MVSGPDKTVDFDRYLQGPDAQGLNERLEEARSTCLDHWGGRHREYGDGGAYTPRGIIVAALHFGHKVTVCYNDAGQVRSAGPGLVWDFEGNNVEIVTPDNRPGSVWTAVDVDSIISVEVFAEDGFDHMRSTTDGIDRAN
ncbi:hypothetical protein [Nocardia pseudovaccinii]|uniref:hypothetical protein n=1 Tax=Nocardia pseudovaccinii TaxID=189540 RepID=UPI0007A3973A|nr:hypothetical protein [Nocardia pseudovaccinii]